MAMEKKKQVKHRKELAHPDKKMKRFHGKKLIDLSKIKPINFIFLTVAGFINAAGVALFLVPWQIIDGGLSGTSYLVNFFTQVPLSVWLVVLNIPFFILAWKRMGVTTIVYSIYAIAMYSLATYLYQYVFKFCGPNADLSPFVTEKYDLILAAIFGGLLSGIGSGLTIRFGGALDGVEVMGVMFAKRIGLTVGQFVMSYNAVQYIFAGIFLPGGFQIPLYSIIAYAVGLKAVDFIVDGLDKGKAAIIITGKAQELGQGISETMGRGITMLQAKGFYSGEEKAMLYCVVNRFEIGTLKRVVTALDPTAFVSINEVSDMMGETGIKFTRRKKKSVPAGSVPVADDVAISAVEPGQETDRMNESPDLPESDGRENLGN